MSDFCVKSISVKTLRDFLQRVVCFWCSLQSVCGGALCSGLHAERRADLAADCLCVALH
jgi:hypothetical protein